LSKRKFKKSSKSFLNRLGWQRQPSIDLETLFEQADNLDQNQLGQVIASLETDVGEVASQLKLPVDKMEQGLRYLEEGQRALHRGDFKECIARNRRAIQILGNWPPPHNNLALALFFDGQPQLATATARHVLENE